MVDDYRQGDIVMMDFSPQAGHEQSGRRPALILSNDILNRHSSTAMVCPITNTKKNHPFHIPLDDRTKTTGVILCDQTKMLDIRARNAAHLEAVPEEILKEARELIMSFL